MKNKRGVSIYIAIFCLLLFSSLAFVISSLVATHTETATNYLAAEQALHIAEAGNQYAIWYLTQKDQYWTTSETSERPLGSGAYTLEVYDDLVADKKVVISTGYVPDSTNPQAKRIAKLEGTFGDIKDGTHPIYKYAIYTDSTDTDSGLQLIFDESKYYLSTDDDVHSNNNILFRNEDLDYPNKPEVDGTVYSAGTVTKENWPGTPWGGGKEDYVDTICPPYLDDVTRDYYRERAIAQERYYSGDKTFTDLVELGTKQNPALIYVEGKVKIGNVKYHWPLNPNKYGVGTIVSGGGDITIFGSIEPAGGASECTLALVSFYDTKYVYEIVEPFYYEEFRELHIQDTNQNEKLKFSTLENITIKYTTDLNKYGYLTVTDYNGTKYRDRVDMIRTPAGGGKFSYSYTITPSQLSGADWYYFKVEISDKKLPNWDLKEMPLAHFIVDEPAIECSIKTYSDSIFTKETSAFDNQADVYLQIYGNSSISSIQISNYTLSTWDCTSTIEDEHNFDSFRRCKFQLPLLPQQNYWYNLKVSTAGTVFYKQIYIKPSGAVPIYACSHSNNYFRLEESADLNIIGNLTARHGLDIMTADPLSNIKVTYDTEIFRDPDRPDWNPYALPGSVSFEYTWKED